MKTRLATLDRYFLPRNDGRLFLTESQRVNRSWRATAPWPLAVFIKVSQQDERFFLPPTSSKHNTSTPQTSTAFTYILVPKRKLAQMLMNTR